MNIEETRLTRQQEMVLAYRLFVGFGWGDLGDGHISARDPEREDCFWLLNAEVPFAEASIDNLVLLGPEGRVVTGKGSTNWPAFYIHWPILMSRSDIVSVAHTHTPYGTPFAAEARELEPITQESCVFFEDHAVFNDEEVQVQSVDCGFRIANALDQFRSVILRNHGLLTVGKTVRESLVWFVMMERVAEAHLKSNKPTPISHNAALFAKADLATDAQVDHAFKNLTAFHLNRHNP